MGFPLHSLKWNRVLVDVCTQRDYLDADGILKVANREALLPKLRVVFHGAVALGCPVVSLVESHRPAEPVNGFPLHCIDGTPGQEKLPFTLLTPWRMVETDNYLSLPTDVTENTRQLIFRKRTRDILSNPKADRFLTHLNAEFLLFGVGLERALKSLALGLLARHKTVAVISDACGYWSAADGDLAARQLSAKGVRLISVASLLAEETPTRERIRPRTRILRDRHHPELSARTQRPSRSDVA